MVQTIKSVLLFEYDSVYRSLNAVAPGVGDLLGPRAGLWLEAIESGEIIRSANIGEDVRRRFQSKRCYASPEILGKNRGWLTANGMQVIDCTVPIGLMRGSGDIHLVLDALDAVDAEPDEIILVTAETDLTPLLFRLRAMNQRLVIYSTAETAGSYQTFADAIVSQEMLVAALSQPSEQEVVAGKGSIPRPPRISMPEPQRRAPARREPPAAAAATPPAPRPEAARPERQTIDRETLALLVRRIHQATNVPLFSPRAFADLFRLLAQEIGRTGYKFQTNSDTVAAEMNKLGRNVSKRQIGFIIKGLTLRGHVFTAEDTPESLAEGFYEQVMYLVANAKLDLTESEQGLIRAWIVGFRSDEEQPAPARRAEPEPAPPPRPAAATRPEDRRPQPRPAEDVRPRQAARPTPPPAAARPSRPAPDRPPMKAAQRPVRVQPAPAEPAEPSFASRMVRNGASSAAPRVRRPPPVADREAELEDSILSAIADAVDVLADDSDPPPARQPRARPASVEPEPEQERAPFDAEFAEDEIGDEIQRILSSYSDRR